VPKQTTDEVARRSLFRIRRRWLVLLALPILLIALWLAGVALGRVGKLVVVPVP
jgi:hypothetical protein